MFTVRGKSGKVVGQYATKAEAERRIAQLKAGAARLRPFRFAARMSPMRGRIGIGGIQQTARFDVKPSHLYALGASSSPDVVYVTQVTGDRIKYLRWPYTGNENVIERWIGEDLIAQGTRTHLKNYGDRGFLRGMPGRPMDLEELRETIRREREANKSPSRGHRSPSTGTKQKIYRGFLIKISHGGTWCEGNIYKKDGSIAEHIGSGSCGPGASLKAATIGKMIERGERIIDAMQGD